MKAKIYMCGLVSGLILLSCAKEVPTIEETFSAPFLSDVLQFNNAEELQNYVDNGIENKIETKSHNNFVSLWDYQYKSFMDSLDENSRQLLMADDLVYEPEDEIIVDPLFAKVLNPKREIQVGNQIYRYVREGVIIYDSNVSGNVVDSIDINSVNADSGYIQEIVPGVYFQKIVYGHLTDNIQTRVTVPDNTSINNRSIILGGGIVIPSSNIEWVRYEQDESDANGFSKWISGLFGTNVVAIKEFDSKHRIRLRTFSQDYGIYRSVGMAVRFQQKVMGSWFRYKAPEIRYGWTAVECIYRFRDPFTNALKEDLYVIEKTIEGYTKPVLLFNVPLANITNVEVTKAISSALNKSSDRVTKWINANPSCKDNPRGVVSFEGTNSLRLIYPQMEDIEYDDRREKISWDFNWFSSLMNYYAINGSEKYERRSFALSPVNDIAVNRGEFYAAVKYDNKWMACVIYNN